MEPQPPIKEKPPSLSRRVYEFVFVYRCFIVSVSSVVFFIIGTWLSAYILDFIKHDDWRHFPTVLSTLVLGVSDFAIGFYCLLEAQCDQPKQRAKLQKKG